MSNSPHSRRQTWITAYRIITVVALVVLVGITGILLARPTTHSGPTASQIATAVNGPVAFQRPSSMEYVAKTNSCVVGGTVTSAKWHVGSKVLVVGSTDSNSVEYTEFGFKADDGQVFSVSSNGALFTEAGENLGLEVHCDPATMKTSPSFGLVAIISGGK